MASPRRREAEEAEEEEGRTTVTQEQFMACLERYKRRFEAAPPSQQAALPTPGLYMYRKRTFEDKQYHCWTPVGKDKHASYVTKVVVCSDLDKWGFPNEHNGGK